MDRDLKDTVILQVLKMGSWLWDRVYNMKSASILGSRESTGVGGGMKRNILWLSEQLEKLQVKNLIILGATECNSETATGNQAW